MEHSAWKQLASEILIDTPFYVLRKDRVQLPNGQIIDDYYVRDGPSFAVIFALTPDQRVLLVRQYKYGVNKVVLELPAGMMDKDEAAEETAARELEEETGYRCERMEHVADFGVGATNASTIMHLFFAHNATPSGKQKLDPGENIEIVSVTLDELLQKTQNGEIDQMAHAAAVYHMLVKIGYLANHSSF